MKKNNKALVTLAIGERYVDEFESQVSRSWRAYADKHGYDIIVLTDVIDKSCDLSRKSLHWQKLLIGLVPGVSDYDHVVWMDTDILINARTAPCVVSAVEQTGSDKIAVADYNSTLSPLEDTAERYYILDQLFRKNSTKIDVPPLHMEDVYKNLGYLKPVDKYINTGMFVFQPKRHNDFLSQCYAKYEADSADGSFENIPYSYELQAEDMAVFIDERFNMAWSKVVATHYPFLYLREFVMENPEVAVKCVNVYYHNAWFCHFAGHGQHPINKGLMEEVQQSANHVIEGLAPDLWKSLDLNFSD
ncbi:MAG: hypothetical protein HOL37_04185 [Rhodospirillaceae bacterium]|jgi:hypothetical protein|nr:hypothetical protein [Rhodospirillaceae bacterium]MBT4220238.1 hypothetical protein [Rhodospirillaceae bacterium]MBT4463979.1 hypothetical protein [Rhodospirillaceae bacterium]MBT5308514.1 hypothetical protein [Rhodospirillaceae bacterium]MBT7355553.1 hypothetical protein [Rhodospirillaceae bacterium]